MRFWCRCAGPHGVRVEGCGVLGSCYSKFDTSRVVQLCVVAGLLVALRQGFGIFVVDSTVSAREAAERLLDVVPNGILAASSRCVVVGILVAPRKGYGVVVVDHTVSVREAVEWLRDAVPNGILAASSRSVVAGPVVGPR